MEILAWSVALVACLLLVALAAYSNFRDNLRQQQIAKLIDGNTRRDRIIAIYVKVINVAAMRLRIVDKGYNANRLDEAMEGFVGDMASMESLLLQARSYATE